MKVGPSLKEEKKRIYVKKHIKKPVKTMLPRKIQKLAKSKSAPIGKFEVFTPILIVFVIIKHPLIIIHS